MANDAEVAVVPVIPAPRLFVLAVEETLGDRLAWARSLRDRLVNSDLKLDMGDLVRGLVVLWLSFAVGLALWWLVRGVTLWLQKPRAKKVPPVTPPTTDELMERARETFKTRIKCIDESDLPNDAKKQARQDAERRYMHEVNEVLQCK